MNHPRTINSFTKHIGILTQYGSLKDPRLHGFIFTIVDVFNPFDDPNHNYTSFASAKSYLELISGPTELKFTEVTYVYIPWKVVFLETESVVKCYDYGLPKPMNTKIYIDGKNIRRNASIGMIFPSLIGKLWPVMCVEQDGIKKFANGVKIKGPCNLIYDEKSEQTIGGKIRIETDSEIEFTENEPWLSKIRRFLNVS